ncbi:MAG: alanine racemase [Legionellales bacterium RIFCSPHIGHO2_12_FULL_37_14]|nr:MAG: alanine racemase [Legionellales bacterium RIFCSPHIGHO2_12_FULL_37_14]
MFSKVFIDETALLHNLQHLKRLAAPAKFLAMVKTDAYGCGLKNVVPLLDGHVDAFGVVTIDEALAIRQLGAKTPCVIFQGVLTSKEWQLAAKNDFTCAIHQKAQLETLLHTNLSKKVAVWLKINTGMNRLGLLEEDVPKVIKDLTNFKWIKTPLTLMTHFANADNLNHPLNKTQINNFHKLTSKFACQTSINNSAAILQNLCPKTDVVRAGISLYGVSPFQDKDGIDLGLVPVMRFESIIVQIYKVPQGALVGYGSIWQAQRPSLLGVIPTGYGDGYPRVVNNAYVAINGHKAQIIGRVSMNSMVIDLTDLPQTKVNTKVELWGKDMPVEKVARAANTIGYELLCRMRR